MRLCFYNGTVKGAKFVHKAILLASSPYTHVELEFDDDKSFSSEFGIGPRIKQIDYSHPERWMFVDLPWITAEAQRRVRYRAELHAALCNAGYEKYDTRGALGCAVTGHDDRWNWYCSEVVYDVLAPEIAIPALNFKMHPQRLYELVQVIKDLHTI